MNTVRAGGGLTVFYIKTGARTSKEERGESDSILRPSFQILDPAVPGADALGSMLQDPVSILFEYMLRSEITGIYGSSELIEKLQYCFI